MFARSQPSSLVLFRARTEGTFVVSALSQLWTCGTRCRTFLPAFNAPQWLAHFGLTGRLVRHSLCLLVPLSLLLVPPEAPAQTIIGPSLTTVRLQTFSPATVFLVQPATAISASGNGIEGNNSAVWTVTNNGFSHFHGR